LKNIFLKDMAYRRTRVVLTAIGITVLILLILFLGGIMNGMRIQATQYVKSTGADIWISAEGSGGAFIGFSMLIEEYMASLSVARGLEPHSASPLVFAQARPIIRGKPSKAIVVGYQPGKLGGPSRVFAGRMFAKSKLTDYSPEAIPDLQVVVDEKMGLEIGERIVIGGKELKVVGKVESLMFVLDTPLLFMNVRTAQNVLLGNYPRVNMMIAKSATGFTPEQAAKQFENFPLKIEVRTLQQTIDDIIDYYVVSPMRAVTFLRVMLWLAAGILVGMITYVTTLEKTQEIGVLKAIGASNVYVMQLILKQVVLISIVGVLCGLILAFIFAAAAPIFVSIHLLESIIVAAISFIVCCFSGYLAARKVVAVDPMLAFRGEI
jgi:putative ABC transport system permease protein